MAHKFGSNWVPTGDGGGVVRFNHGWLGNHGISMVEWLKHQPWPYLHVKHHLAPMSLAEHFLAALWQTLWPPLHHSLPTTVTTLSTRHFRCTFSASFIIRMVALVRQCGLASPPPPPMSLAAHLPADLCPTTRPYHQSHITSSAITSPTHQFTHYFSTFCHGWHSIG